MRHLFSTGRWAVTCLVLGAAIWSPAIGQTTAPPSPSAPTQAAPATGQTFPNQFRVYDTTNYQRNGTAWPSFSYLTLTRREVAARYARAQAFVRCALGDEDPQAILNTGLGSGEERRLINKLSLRNVRCGGSAGGLSVRILRAALGEIVINRVFEPNSSLLILSDAASDRPSADAAIEPKLASAFRVAGCHIAAQPGAARTVLTTKPGTREEQAAEDALFAAAPDCAGKALPKAVNPVIYRAVLASVMSRSLAVTQAKG